MTMTYLLSSNSCSDPDSYAYSIDEVRKQLAVKLDKVNKILNPKIRSSTVLSILQDNPCHLKCKHLIINKTSLRVDSFYLARHDYVMKKLIDAIIEEFGDSVEVKAEAPIQFGKLDLKVQFKNSRIVSGCSKKIIAIELKTGISVTSDHFFQLDRYLLNADVLIKIRVPTEDVAVIHSTLVKDEMMGDIKSSIHKADEILVDKPAVVPGPWCVGCNATCDYIKEKSEDNDSTNASFRSYEDSKKHVKVIIKKTIVELNKIRNQILSENETAKLNQCHAHAVNIERDTMISKEKDNGKIVYMKTKISELSIPNMENVLIEGKIEKISEPQPINTKSGRAAIVADAIIADDTGKIKLSLWDKQIDLVKQGDKIIIEGGYTRDYHNEIILGIQRIGNITKT
jgi:replication factor A1